MSDRPNGAYGASLTPSSPNPNPNSNPATEGTGLLSLTEYMHRSIVALC